MSDSNMESVSAEFSATIKKANYEIDEPNKLIKFKGVSGVSDAGNIAKSIAKNTAKATLATVTMGASLLSKKGRSFGKGKTDGGSVIIKLEEVTSYEIIEHTGTRSDTNKRTGALGAITHVGRIGIGGGRVKGKEVSDQSETVEDINAEIKTTNLDHPSISISFLSGRTTRDTEAYKQGINNARELISTLDLLSEKGMLGCHSESNDAASGISDETLDQLRKLKELLDMGVLSQEEFDSKKLSY